MFLDEGDSISAHEILEGQLTDCIDGFTQKR